MFGGISMSEITRLEIPHRRPRPGRKPIPDHLKRQPLWVSVAPETVEWLRENSKTMRIGRLIDTIVADIRSQCPDYAPDAIPAADAE